MVFYNLGVPKEWEGGANWGYFINLRNVENSDGIIRCFAKVLSGTESEMGGLHNKPNLSWFADIAYDFFFENWGKPKKILVVGGEKAQRVDSLIFFSAIECVNDAFRDVLCEKVRFGADREEVFQENLTNYNLEVYMG